MDESQNHQVELKKPYTKESTLDISTATVPDDTTLIYTDRKEISNYPAFSRGWRQQLTTRSLREVGVVEIFCVWVTVLWDTQEHTVVKTHPTGAHLVCKLHLDKADEK